MEPRDFPRYEVIGQFPIVDAVTGADVVRGQVVQLDPERTKITALIEAGHIKETAAKSSEKKA